MIYDHIENESEEVLEQLDELGYEKYVEINLDLNSIFQEIDYLLEDFGLELFLGDVGSCGYYIKIEPKNRKDIINSAVKLISKSCRKILNYLMI